MRLVLIRHGKAKQDSPTGLDADRPLKPRGLRQAAFLAERLLPLRPVIERVITSRAARAHGTAEIITAAWGLGLEDDPRLIVDAPVSGVLDLIGENSARTGVALIGHNPQLERLTALLTGRPVASVPPLRTGEAVVLEIHPAEPLESGAELDRLRLDEDDEA